MKTNKKGVSLIVLVLTIVIMIILAGVIITNLNNSGIISRGKGAVKQTNLKQVQEMATTAWGEAIIENVDATVDELKTSIRAKLLLSGIKEEELGNYYLDVTQNSVKVMLWEDAPNVIATVDGVPIPKGFVASPYGADKANGKAENTKEGGLVIYELKKGETEIPSTESYHTSLTTRNQYVWVPVDKDKFDTTFVRKDWQNNNSVIDESGNYYEIGTPKKQWEPEPGIVLNSTNMQYTTQETLDEVQKMYASVEKYGGFYIGRYEAGLDDNNIRSIKTKGIVTTLENVHSKMNKVVYNWVHYSESAEMNDDKGGAVEIARSLYPENNKNYGVVSTLTYGVQWDRTISWWIETGSVANLTDSILYGNYASSQIAYESFNEGARYFTGNHYGDAVYVDIEEGKGAGVKWLLTTGATEKTRVNNIYDMAGNLWERTMTGTSDGYAMFRGGSYSWDDSSCSVSWAASNNNIMTYPNNKTYSTLRPCLYIK